MQDDDIAQYLTNNPDFFEKHASLLADIHLPSPHGGGTISLAERQQIAQRDKITALKERYAELIVNAQENDTIAGKMHQFFVNMQRAKDFDDLEQLISHNLTEDFNIIDTCLRIWHEPIDAHYADYLVFSDTPEKTINWINDIHNVYCGATPTTISTEAWFLEEAKSIAVLPLRNREKVYGFLALASDKEKRFYVGMGTDFLQMLCDHAGAAFSRHIVD